MLLVSKNIYATYQIQVIKVRYRDLERIKLKIWLVAPSGFMGVPFNCTVKPDWFSRFYKVNEEPVRYIESQELLTVDDYKDWSL